MDIWKPFGVSPDQCYRTQIGPLRLRLRKAGDEIHIAVERLTDRGNSSVISAPEPVDDSGIDDQDWSRWVCDPDVDTLQLMPKTPDRPVVVRPALPVNLPPNQKAVFFVTMPIWVGIAVGQGKQVLLCEEPSLIVSNIWFGDPMSGDLCYSLRTRARRQIMDIQTDPHRAVCPVTIHNAATKGVEISRFCVRAEHLHIYLGQSRLWANGVSITFKGENEISQVSYAEESPDFEPIERVLSEPRIPMKKPILKRSIGGFSFLDRYWDNPEGS